MLAAAVVVPILVPCGFCPPWGVFLLVVVSGVYCLVLWASWGFCPPWAVSVPFGRCDWCLSFGALGAPARPGVFVFFPEWLSFVFGVCLLALWDPGTSAHVEVSICFFVWVFCPSVVSLFLLGGCGWQLSFVAGRCCWCFSFGALWLLPALGCFCFGGWGWCFC